MKVQELSSKVSNWDASIKRGELKLVRSEILQTQLKNVPREYRCALANIFRRVQLFGGAAKMLFPLVRGESHHTQASPEEIAEYCMTLIRIGSTQEARSLLEKQRSENKPEILLSRAFLEIVEWNYFEAKQILSDYLESPGLTEYQILVAEINLAFAFVQTRGFSQGQELLHRLIKKTTELSLHMPLAACLDYLCTLFIETEDFIEASKALLKAREAVSPSYRLHQISCDKLENIIASRHQRSEKTIENFQQIKERAREIGDFETLRDCDYCAAKYADSENSFQSYVLGTPYESAQIRAAGLRWRAPDSGVVERLELGDIRVRNDISGEIFDMSNPIGLKIGQNLHRAIAALNFDFYRPLSVGGFYQFVYEGDYFDPHTAQDRVHQALRRLRVWIKSHDMGWTVDPYRKGFKLCNRGGRRIGLTADLQERQMTWFSQIFSRVKKCTEGQAFSAEMILDLQLCSRQKTYDFLKQAVAAGRIVKLGTGKLTTYYIKKENKS